MTEDNIKQFLSIVHVDDYDKRYKDDIKNGQYFGYPLDVIMEAEHNLLSKDVKSVAYFSMEYGLAPSIYHPFAKHRGVDEANKFDDHKIFSNMRAIDYYVKLEIEKMLDLPIYSGGLGVLAGDTIKTAADLGISMVAVGILWHKGYFKQNFWFRDGQTAMDMPWDPYTYPGLIPLEHTIKILMKNETINLKLWKYYVFSFDKKHVVPLVLLDASIKENNESKRNLTDRLYMSSDVQWKIFQRAILGMGGIKAITELGYNIGIYHLNEGHAALAYIEKSKETPAEERAALKEKFAYTCHTPVAAGHDRFYIRDLEPILNDEDLARVKEFGMEEHAKDMVNLTVLAMNTSKYINAVSVLHSEVTKAQFPSYADRIIPITNGVHIYTWLSEHFAELFDKYKKEIGNWKKDPTVLKHIVNLRANKKFRQDLWQAHQMNKKRLIHLLRHWHFKDNVFTISWARRIAAYKRPSLILQSPQRLIDIAKNIGPIQIIFAGKVHPNDDIGDTFLSDMLDRIDSLHGAREFIKIVILENYDTFFGKLLTNSVDLWLNNPLPPFEASGTSGMKAILNGVVQLSTVDGWVAEAMDRNIGWFFGHKYKGGDIGTEHNLRLEEDSQALYAKLNEVATLYYRTNKGGHVAYDSAWIDKMIDAIAAASFFNTHRMVNDYTRNIWSKV